MKGNENGGEHRPPLNVSEAADYLGVNERFIRARRNDRTLPVLKMGRLIRFDPDDLDQYLADSREDGLLALQGAH